MYRSVPSLGQLNYATPVTESESLVTCASSSAKFKGPNRDMFIAVRERKKL